MAKFSRTWWGDRFIQALEDLTDDNRLKRGRSYASDGKVKSFEIEQNQITAQVVCCITRVIYRFWNISTQH